MVLDIQDFDGAPALDAVQQVQAAVGTGWLNGCTPSLVDTDDAIRIQVASGDVAVVPDPTSPPSDPTVAVSQQTVDLPDGDAQHPRKDVVYVDDTGSVDYDTGTPRAATPPVATARDAETPEPPDLHDDPNLSSQTAAAVIAEVWVPTSAAGASDLSDATVTYVRDRRLRPWADHVLTGSDSVDADTVDGEDASAFADASHASAHESGGSDTIDPDALAGFDEAAQDAAGALATDGLNYDDGADELGLNVIASGSATLSSGEATIDTGVATSNTATFTVYLAPDTDDADVAAEVRSDSGSGNYEVDLVETETSVGNPSVFYDIVRLR
jgi:hypothetical protein